MILHDFIYARPETKEEAVWLHNDCTKQEIIPLYYGGGSEIITMCRASAIEPGAVIDLKQIPECNEFGLDDEALVIGGCVALRAIEDSKWFPLLGEICGRIADHTNQCRITLGGNMCGTIIYRETIQGLLLSDADILLFGPNGLRIESIHSVFNRRMRLQPGEFVLQVRIPRVFTDAPYNHVKKTANEKIDYPLLSMSTLEYQGDIRIAISGLYDHPFRDKGLENAFNDKTGETAHRLGNMLACLPDPPIADYQGSSEYRLFVLKQTLAAMMEVWKR